MWEPLQTLINAQAAVTQKIVRHWAAFLRASAIPAAVAVGVLIWMVEAYWASAGFMPGQIAVMISAGAAVFYLSALSLGRLVRIGLGIDHPRQIRALAAGPADTRVFMLCLGLLGLAVLAALLQFLATRAVLISFFAPGSDTIAHPVLAFSHAAILLGLYYLLGRLALFLPAQAAAPGASRSIIWQATEGHGAILFIVVLAVPWASAVLLAGPVLWWIGALPWPGFNEFARAQTLGLQLGERLYLVVPLLFLTFIALWSLAAAGLCAAWDALKERGALEKLPAPA